MPIFSAIVLFAFIWFLTLLAVLQQRTTTQTEAGEVVSGTHGSAPADVRMGRKIAITTGVATVIWAGLVYVIVNRLISIDAIDRFSHWVYAG